MKLEIRKLSADERDEIRSAVKLAMAYWPNAHLGDNTSREDMRVAFKRIRRDIMAYRLGAFQAASNLRMDAYAYADM